MPKPDTLQRPRFGAHMSAAGGLENAFAAAQKCECDALQVFVKNQRQWKAAELNPNQIEAYKQAAGKTKISPVVAHASYLINLASPDNDMRQKSIDALADEHRRCEILGIDGLVFHPGAHLDDTIHNGIKRIIKALNDIQKNAAKQQRQTTGKEHDHHKPCTILLETTAGQGSAIGYRFEQLRDILAGLKNPGAFGICLDTCHLFAAGYDFRTTEGYSAMIDEMESAIGVASVQCIHTNDSKKECGSRVDRHDHIGKGKIGNEGFRHFVNDPTWHNLPFILETPKGKDGRGSDLDKVNIKRLKKLIDKS